MTSLQVSPQQAAAELLRRRRARESLAGFANAIDVPGRPLKEEDAELDWLFQPVETTLAAHHLLLLRHLDDLVNPAHSLRSMMVFMPPASVYDQPRSSRMGGTSRA